jgi:hypothetical protein
MPRTYVRVGEVEIGVVDAAGVEVEVVAVTLGLMLKMEWVVLRMYGAVAEG